jgi:uncharacterized membrane protein YgcG
MERFEDLYNKRAALFLRLTALLRVFATLVILPLPFIIILVIILVILLLLFIVIIFVLAATALFFYGFCGRRSRGRLLGGGDGGPRLRGGERGRSKSRDRDRRSSRSLSGGTSSSGR